MTAGDENQIFEDLYNDVYFGSQARKFRERNINHWAPRISKVFSLVASLELKGNKVLDLGTSVGTYAFEFAKRGYEAVGIDLSERAISIARDIAASEKTDIEYIVGDVANRQIFPREHFDLIYAGDIVEHLLDDELRNTVENCYSWLRPGGYFLFHTVPMKYDIIFHKSFLWLLLVPTILFPERVFKRAVEWTYSCFDRSLKVLTGRSWMEREGATVHCNLQTAEGFRAVLLAAGFQIVVMEATITEDRFSDGVGAVLFRNREYFQKDLFGIARKLA